MATAFGSELIMPGFGALAGACSSDFLTGIAGMASSDIPTRKELGGSSEAPN